MNLLETPNAPLVYPDLLKRTKEVGFTMPSDVSMGSLLQTLVASKPNGIFLELGTGTGLSLAWILEGMQGESKILSLDNDEQLIQIVSQAFRDEHRLELICTDGAEWISSYEGDGFDLIFADTWAGKYTHLDETLAMVKEGGFYVIDDMNPQPNWPEGHGKKAEKLLETLAKRKDFIITRLDWSTGIVIAVKKSSNGK
ncbi:O-methyltransferase [Flagellimonas sp.]|uniref:O-methyltransferase n=1 Tax=Flagellimonas sp. TaxID=2058762 RepID=UPI003F4A5106